MTELGRRHTEVAELQAALLTLARAADPVLWDACGRTASDKPCWETIHADLQSALADLPPAVCERLQETTA